MNEGICFLVWQPQCNLPCQETTADLDNMKIHMGCVDAFVLLKLHREFWNPNSCGSVGVIFGMLVEERSVCKVHRYRARVGSAWERCDTALEPGLVCLHMQSQTGGDICDSEHLLLP